MEYLTRPLNLRPEMTRVLAEITAGAGNALYGCTAAEAETRVNRRLMPLLSGSGMPHLLVMHYSWFLRELGHIWRTHEGRDLAFHVELCLRKWQNFGLEVNTLQLLVCELHRAARVEASGIEPGGQNGGH
jgi:hypothetical protein